MNNNQTVFVTPSFVCHEYDENTNSFVMACYARENGRFRKISQGSADTIPAECGIELDELIQDIGDPASTMWDVPVYVDSATTITDLEAWYIRQLIAKSMHDILVPACLERLYKSGSSYLHVYCEADEGWNYALYAEDDEGFLRLKDGGYIEGRITAPVDEIASSAVRRLLLEGPLEKARISKKQLFDWVVEKEDLEYRGVKAFLSPELKAAGIDAVPSETIDTLKKIVDERLLRPILMTYDPEHGYRMDLVAGTDARKDHGIEVPLPDGTAGILIQDPSVQDETASEYDTDWARQIWLQDIYIRIRSGKYVLESE